MSEDKTQEENTNEAKEEPVAKSNEETGAEKTEAAEKVAPTPPSDADASDISPQAGEDTEAAPEDEAEEVVEVTDEERKAAVEMPHRDLKPGMVVRVHEIIKDTNSKGEERERTQVFEGTILGFAGSGIGRTMTVRKVSKGFGVEKIYPLASPHVEKVEVVKQLRARRSKLWFLRKGKTKRRIKEIPLKNDK